MMYKNFFNSKPLFIVSRINKEIEEYLHHEDTVLIDEFNSHSVKAMLHEMALEKIHAGVFVHHDETEVFSAIKRKYNFVQAAGGFVYTEDNKILLIFRRAKWDLPKGKLDEGEELESCALREIKEETGIQQIRSEGKLCTTWHTYHQDGRHWLKESHWFMVKGIKQNELVPQLEEDIEKCEWVAVDQLAPYLENSLGSIIDVVTAGVKQLHLAKNV
jgi:8-oxo-dGTP pyrophosphatase MutT (NUDIX family)